MSAALSSHREKKENPTHEDYMQRCLHLADLGAGFTAPNPMVGAILVYEQRIIGEGYHKQFGGPHAEVNCIESVQHTDRSLISSSTMYVSLEPCCHYGKTPPCTDLIIREKIPNVVIGCRDPFSEVDGKGIEKLIANGVHVEFPVLEKLSIEKNRRFFTFHQLMRPYIILKWAESANHKMAGGPGRRILISNPLTDRQVHKWRSEESAILIGTNTALLDNPQLTNRLWTGKNPVRVVLDLGLRLPGSLTIFDKTSPTIILNGKKELQTGNLTFKKMNEEHADVSAIASTLHASGLLSVLVEGGAKLLQSFIDAGVWDELRIITNHELEIPEGLSSPDFRNARPVKSETFGSDNISYYRNRLSVRV